MIRLSPELKAHIAAIAEDHGLSPDTFVEKIVTQHLAAAELEAEEDLRVGLQ